MREQGGGLIGARDVRAEIELAFDVDLADISGLVQDALKLHPLSTRTAESWSIPVANTVTRIGHVLTQAQRDAASRAAWQEHGVMAVVDLLTQPRFLA
jgi:osmotically-inducible protein OsmY